MLGLRKRVEGRTIGWAGQGKTCATTALMSVLLATGCRQDMHNQPKFIPQRGTDFYADGRSSRPQVENTVARGQMHEDAYFYTGMNGGQEGNGMPMPVTMDVLARGQERYNIYCTPCHSRVGNGAGMIVQRGYRPAGNFHTERLRNAPLGHLFSVISNGYGAMPDYAAQLPPEDRWAVVAYIKALQLSQNAQQGDVAGSEKVETLGDVARREGFAEQFANEWVLPSTAVYGTPNNQDNGVPGQDLKSGMSGGATGPQISGSNATAKTPAVTGMTRKPAGSTVGKQ